LFESGFALGAFPFQGLLLPDDVLGEAMRASDRGESFLARVAFPEGGLGFPNGIGG
jgi:hypothetical protein